MIRARLIYYLRHRVRMGDTREQAIEMALKAPVFSALSESYIASVYDSDAR